MGWVRWAIVVLALLPGFWMTFDGTRALVTGDYVTPRNGEYAGQLGPWRHLVSAIGIEPRSTGMKAAFVVFGLLWLAAGAACLVRAPHANIAILALAIATLWYLPVGTLVSIAEIVLAALMLRTGPDGV